MTRVGDSLRRAKEEGFRNVFARTRDRLSDDAGEVVKQGLVKLVKDAKGVPQFKYQKYGFIYLNIPSYCILC